jgi:hypothetical protein
MSLKLRVALFAACALTAGCFAGNPSAVPPTPAASPGALSSALPTRSSSVATATADVASGAVPTAGQAAEPTQSVEPVATPTESPEMTPSDTPRPTRDPMPTPRPAPDPSVVVLVNGHSGNRLIAIDPSGTTTVELRLRTNDLDRDGCHLTHDTDPDKPGLEPSSVALAPVRVQTVLLIDGQHRFSARCPTGDGPLKFTTTIRAADGLPERCLDWSFEDDDLSADTLAELEAGMVGRWHGCVMTPWTLPYWVTLEFRSDGTYSAVSSEEFDGQEMIALYYGSDEDFPEKRWWINDLQDSGKGIGEIDIVFDQGSVNRDELRNVKLMGDTLDFELFHAGMYGPVLLQLLRD